MHSGEVLLALTRAGILREDAYAAVQRSAMATWTTLGRAEGKSFRTHLEADPTIAGHVPPEVLDRAMDANLHLARLDEIFDRVFGTAA